MNRISKEMTDIALPAPNRRGGMPLMEALNLRQSSRDLSNTPLDMQTLSDLLWAAWGYNREHKRTAPSSHNRQEIDLYLFLESGTYIYDAAGNRLLLHDDEDLRSLTGTQEFVGTAAVEIAMVADTSKIKGKSHQGTIEAIYANTGFISQNIYLFCAQAGLGGVTRAMVPKEELAQRLRLNDSQIITLVHTVGYKK